MGDTTEEVSALIAVLHETEQRLEALTAGEVDTVADAEGRTLLLRRAQEHLRHGEAAKQTAILNALPAAIALLDSQGRIVSANEAWRQLAHTNALQGREYWTGLNYLGALDNTQAKDAPEAHQAAAGIRSVLAGRAQSFSLEYPNHSATKQRWFLLTVTPLADGPPGGAVVMHSNVTALKQAAQDIRESDRRFSDLLRNVELAAVMLDREARITFCNAYLLRLTGWQYEEVIGRDWFELFMPSDLGDMKPVFQALLSNLPEAWHRDHEIYTRSGERRLIRWNNSVLRSGAGEVIGTASIGEDITERKEAERRIAYLNRVHAMLSGVNTLIVRGRDRDELYRKACQLAVAAGGFRMALIAVVDQHPAKIIPVASAGKDEALLNAIKEILSSSESAPTSMVARAIRTREAIVSNDSLHDPQVLLGTRYAESGVRSLAVLPLIVADEAVGVIALYAGESEFFHTEEMTLLTTLAGDISFGLEHIDKEERIARLTRIQALTSGINALVVRVRDRQELFTEACRIAVDHGGFGIAWIGTFNAKNQEITQVACAGVDAESFSRYRGTDQLDLQASPGEVRRSLREQRAVFNNDLTVSPMAGGKRRQEAIRLGYRSGISLPLLVAGASVGNLSLFARERNFFEADELKLLDTLAGDISFALEHIEKRQSLARLNRIHAVTSGINALIVRVHDRQALFDGACRIAVEAGLFPFAGIGILDPVTQDVVPVALAGAGAEAFTGIRHSALDHTPRGQGVVGRSIRERRAVVNNDVVSLGVGGPRRELILSMGFRSIIALPLFEGQEVTGSLTLYASEPDFFDQEELMLLNGLARDISFGLENINKQQKLDKLARVRAVSSEINAAIVHIHDRNALLRETTRIANEHGKFEHVWLGLLDQAQQCIQTVASAGFSEPTVAGVTWASLGMPGGVLADVMRLRKVVIRGAIDSETPAGTLRHEALSTGHLSSACVPFTVDDSVVAALILFAPGRGFFDADELALLNEVAANVSYALQAIEKREKLQYLSYYDALTGLPNRALFVDRLNQQMRLHESEKSMVGLILLDLDRFRNINESLGHRGGDELLSRVAERLAEAFHGTDNLARISSNGFGAIVHGINDAAGVVHLVEHEVFSRFEQPLVVADREIRVSVKAGIALFPVDGESAEVLFRNAESALRRAKTSSDRYLFYAAQMNAQAANAIALEMQLRKAVEARQFVLHYQPKIELATMRICGLEALIRWNDPATGLIPPATFIPVLEETGMILEVGRWAMEQAMSDHARWVAYELKPPRIAVNVSQVQLRHARFVETVANVASAYANGAAALALEITESLFMENFEESIAKLKAIHDMGIEIAVDDFGTGYSSLSYISRLPVDALKIDRSFVVRMASDPDSMSIVSMVITLAHTLNLKVVAEGVETEEQSTMLKLLRCDEAQGYLFARPLPGESVEALLRERSTAKSS